MVHLLIGGEGNSQKSKMKSNVVDLLSKSEKVCIVCFESDVDYYTKMRWRSRKYHIEDVDHVIIRSPLTIVSFPEQSLNEGKIIDPNLINRLFYKGFTSIFIDESQDILKGFIISDGLDTFINNVNSKFKDVQVTIACQQFKQLIQ